MTTEVLMGILESPVAREAWAAFDRNEERRLTSRKYRPDFVELFISFVGKRKMLAIAYEHGMPLHALRPYWRRYFQSFLGDLRKDMRIRQIEVRKQEHVELQLLRPKYAALRELVARARAENCKVEFSYRYSTILHEPFLKIEQRSFVLYEAHALLKARRRQNRVSFHFNRRRLEANEFVALVIQIGEPVLFVLESKAILDAFFRKEEKNTHTLSISVRRPKGTRLPHSRLDVWAHEGEAVTKLLDSLRRGSARAD